MKYAVIYIPGLFDKSRVLLWIQRQLLRSWSSYGLDVELFVIGWVKGADSFDELFERLLDRIDTLEEAGERVVLVGSSAGASVALNAYAKRTKKIHAMVSICGQLRGTKKVPEAALDLNPRLKASLEMMEKTRQHLSKAERKHILALRPMLDAVVQPDEAFLKGAENVHMPIVGHLAGIGFAILFEAKRIVAFAQSIGKD